MSIIVIDGGTKIRLRDREVLEQVITPASAHERCVYCKEPVVQGRFHWLGKDGQPDRMHPMDGGGILSFPSWRHADAKAGHGQDGLVLPDQDRCPQCRQFKTLSRRETGYGTDSTCTACGWNKYFDRGD